jgi:hypothetical protein
VQQREAREAARDGRIDDRERVGERLVVAHRRAHGPVGGHAGQRARERGQRVGIEALQRELAAARPRIGASDRAGDEAGRRGAALDLDEHRAPGR